MNFIDIYSAVIPYFGITALGVLFRISGLLNNNVEHFFLKLLVRFLLPCLSMTFVLGNKYLHSLSDVMEAPPAAFITIVAGFAAGYVFSSFLGLESEKDKRSFMFPVGIYNYGFLAIPLCDALYGSDIVGIMLVYGIGVDIAYWGVGVPLLASATGFYAVSGDKKNISARTVIFMRRLITPPLIAILFALSMNFTGYAGSVPDSVKTVYSFFGMFTIPMGLFISGSAIAAAVSAGGFFSNFKVIVGANLLRLLFIPFLFVLSARYVPMSEALKKILTVQSAMPAGMFTIAILKLYGGDTKIAVKVILSTTLISLVTIPFWIYFARYFTGV